MRVRILKIEGGMKGKRTQGVIKDKRSV